jgi:hypothetical protein
MAQGNVDVYEEITKEELQRRKKIRELATKTLLNFLFAEVIGFGFGVPLATVLAILYSNTADISMEIYFMPIAVITVVVVVFVAYPTNLYLTRQLIKTIFNPTIDNAQKFSLIAGKVSSYASINLVIRISIGGLIADAWGVVRQGEFVLNRFITLGIAPIVGAFVAGIVFYFVSQRIFSKFNTEIIKMSPIGEVERGIETKMLLSTSGVFSGFISFTVFLVSLILSIGYLFNATMSSMLIITVIGAITIAILLYFYISSVSETVKNLAEATNVLGKKGGKLIVPKIYDIEETVLLVRDYIEGVNENQKKILEKVSSVEKVKRLEAFNSLLEIKLKKLINELRRTKVNEGGVVEARRTLEFTNNKLRGTVNKLVELENNITLLVQEFNRFEEAIRDLSNLEAIERDEINEAEEQFSRVIQMLGEVRKTVESVKESALLVVPRVEDFEKVANSVEVVFINFQLEMARIGYPLEFKVISDRLGKDLERIENVSSSIREQASEISKVNELIIEGLREMAVVSDVAESLFENVETLAKKEKEEFSLGMKEFRKILEVFEGILKEFRRRMVESNRLILTCIQGIDNYLEKVRAVNKVVSDFSRELSDSLALLSENTKSIQKVEEEVKTLRKINEQE